MKTVADFQIQYLQYLDENAALVGELPAFAQSTEYLQRAYRYMLLTRAFDQKAIALQRTGKMGTFPSSRGQEAIYVAIGMAMAKEDVLCPYYRDQAAFIVRGVAMEKIYAYWGGDESGSDINAAREDFPISVPIASQLLHATGVAQAFKYRKEARAVLTTCGDGATSKGDFYEAINLAGAWQLPVVFLVNNNRWAISVPDAQQTHCQTLAQKAIAGGFEGIQVDGNDVIAVQDILMRALDKARTGGGPTLIEALTYRLCDHTTADDATRYQPSADVEVAERHEPVARLHQHLIKTSQWTEEQEKKERSNTENSVQAAAERYLNLPAPAPESMFTSLYETLPDAYLEQLADLMENAHA